MSATSSLIGMELNEMRLSTKPSCNKRKLVEEDTSLEELIEMLALGFKKPSKLVKVNRCEHCNKEIMGTPIRATAYPYKSRVVCTTCFNKWRMLSSSITRQKELVTLSLQMKSCPDNSHRWSGLDGNGVTPDPKSNKPPVRFKCDKCHISVALEDIPVEFVVSEWRAYTEK